MSIHKDAKLDRALRGQPGGSPVATKQWRNGQAKTFTPEDHETAETLGSLGLPVRQIASLIDGGIDVETLRNHFQDDMDRGAARINKEVASKLLQKVEDGDTTALIFWTKARMGWSDKVQMDITSKGQQIAVNVYLPSNGRGDST